MERLTRPIEIRIRLNVEFDSSEAILNDYLHNTEAAPYPFREMVMLALKSYWLPFAYKSQKNSLEKLRQATLDSIYRLQMHLSYLHSVTGIELNELAPLVYPPYLSSTTPKQELPDISSTAAASSVAQTATDKQIAIEEVPVGEQGDPQQWKIPFEFTNALH